MDVIRSLTVEGGPFERGRAHGEALSREIGENVETYFTRFEASGLGRSDAIAEGRNWLKALSHQNPAYLAEMEGIARGAGIEAADIAMLNARYEIAFTLFGRDARAQEELLAIGPDGCSTFGLLPETTADGHTWLGQNWDWLEAIRGRAVVLRVRRKDGPSYVCLTEAGIVGGKMGVNECGIGLVENGLASDQDGANPYQKPFHVRCREIVEAERFEDALRPIVGSRRTCSANFVVGAAEGEIVNLETSPNNVSYLYPVGGMLTHSNHFLGVNHGESQMEKISPNTLYRHSRLRRLLERHAGRLTIEHMSEALADEFGTPNGICRLPDPRQHPAKRSMTVASVLIDLNARVMHVANGPPSTHCYAPFGIDERPAI